MFDKLYNIICGNSNKIKCRCRICNRPVFNINTSWGMRGICVYCGDAYREGKKKGVENISDNDYGYTWYTSKEALENALPIDMIKEGHMAHYDEFFKAYRIYKPKRVKGGFWGGVE